MKRHFALWLSAIPVCFNLAHWLYTIWYTTGITSSLISMLFSDSKTLRAFEPSRQVFWCDFYSSVSAYKHLLEKIHLFILQQHNWAFSWHLCDFFHVLFIFVLLLYLSSTLPTACFSYLSILCSDDGLMNVWTRMIYIQSQETASFRLSWKRVKSKRILSKFRRRIYSGSVRLLNVLLSRFCYLPL